MTSKQTAHKRQYDTAYRRLPRTRPCANGCGRLREPGRLNCQACRAAEYKRVKRGEAITLYGGKCACCGEAEYLFLTFDHVVGRTAGERADRRNGVTLAIDAIRRHGDGHYQLLCFNCNSGRYINGGVCPHQRIDKESDDA